MIAAFKRIVARHWPVLRFRTIILGILLFVAALPGIGAVFLRVYENALVRRTEAELVAQSAALAASAEMIWPGARRLPNPVPHPAAGRYDSGPYEEAATEVDLQSAAILPERPAPMRAHPPIDATALFVARTMAPAMAQTKQVTLASIQLLDRSGVVLNGYGAGGSLARVPEVAAALRGEPTTVLRRNASYRQVYPLEWLSRAPSIRLHHVRPITVNGNVVGAVLVSRSPRSLFKGMYEDRGKIALGVILIFGTLVGLSAILSRAIIRPVESLSRATRSMANGRTVPLERPSLQVVEPRIRAWSCHSHLVLRRSTWSPSCIEAFMRLRTIQEGGYINYAVSQLPLATTACLAPSSIATPASAITTRNGRQSLRALVRPRR